MPASDDEQAAGEHADDREIERTDDGNGAECAPGRHVHEWFRDARVHDGNDVVVSR